VERLTHVGVEVKAYWKGNRKGTRLHAQAYITHKTYSKVETSFFIFYIIKLYYEELASTYINERFFMKIKGFPYLGNLVMKIWELRP